MAEEEYRQQRIAKLERWRARGVDPYPARTGRTHEAAQAVDLFLQAEAAASERDHFRGPVVTVAGRLMALRVIGKVAFGHLQDGSGRIQIYLRRDVVGDDAYAALKDLDLGDFLEATGPLFRTQTGEVTVEVQGYCLLAKALRPLPEKFHGLTDVEKRYRQRYLDLITDPRVREIFRTRSRVISAIRRFMDDRGYLEVETPILQSAAGGAAAKPFVTHHNALDRDLYLRIATELHLKRLVIGGFDRVYEIGRIFRNEGISTKHNPEFTTMESYQAYADYHDIMELVEQLVSQVAQTVLGTTTIPWGDHEVRLDPPWPRIPLREAIRRESGIDFEEYPNAEDLRRVLRERGLAVADTIGRGKLIDELLSTYVEPKLIQPTFLVDYPVELSPLAKRRPDDPRYVERFEGFIGGMEIANSFSELNDPLDQRARFEEQARQRALGDELGLGTRDEDARAHLELQTPESGQPDYVLEGLPRRPAFGERQRASRRGIVEVTPLADQLAARPSRGGLQQPVELGRRRRLLDEQVRHAPKDGRRRGQEAPSC